MKFLTCLCALTAWAWTLPPGVQAHAVGSRQVDAARCRAVLFHYSTGEPMAWARAEVTAPGGAAPFLSGRTDAAGVFAFLPDAPGTWRVSARDDEGHAASAEVTVDSGTAGPGALPESATQGRKPSCPWLAAPLGASLILNVFMGLALVRRKGGP